MNVVFFHYFERKGKVICTEIILKGHITKDRNTLDPIEHFRFSCSGAPNTETEGFHIYHPYFSTCSPEVAPLEIKLHRGGQASTSSLVSLVSPLVSIFSSVLY